jgi:hypothetical protein
MYLHELYSKNNRLLERSELACVVATVLALAAPRRNKPYQKYDALEFA